MAENAKCTCGQSETKRIIFPCAGQANTGQITNLAAIALTEEGFGSIACVALLATGAEGLVKGAMEAEEVVVLDGCPMLCAKKIAQEKGVSVGRHLVVTELGIAKGPSRSYTDDDIETVVSACWEGKGVCKDENKDNKSPCTCGSSCCGDNSAGDCAGVLTVEWRHVGENIDSTCERCSTTGNILKEVLDEIEPLMSEKGIRIEVKETVLPNEKIGESNMILFNGIPLEKLVEGMEISHTPCESCACITGQDDVKCRAVNFEGEIYEAVPAELIRRAAERALEN
ncbi:MAG: DUF2703 domain-containing protein [Methanomicrobiaceae archaeon]|nr:DUF2703 domain-containing protein [Methanomicrobiaceae archaeon]